MSTPKEAIYGWTTGPIKVGDQFFIGSSPYLHLEQARKDIRQSWLRGHLYDSVSIMELTRISGSNYGEVVRIFIWEPSEQDRLDRMEVALGKDR